MAKTNSTRQAEFRARMREEGKQALHIWVTPEQAAKVQAAINLVEPVMGDCPPAPPKGGAPSHRCIVVCANTENIFSECHHVCMRLLMTVIT
jgi:hypothetical protein